MSNNHKNSHHSANQDLVSIFYHTVKYCKKQNFPLQEAIKYDYTSKELSDDNILTTATSFDKPAIILVDNTDSFDMARKMVNTKNSILVLNLASSVSSGGGVKNGARAQEEDLYRKSNYFQANNQNLYPMAESEVIYSPIVHVIKDSSYRLLKTPFVVSCLAVAAIVNPVVVIESSNDNNDKIYANISDQIIMQNKIDVIFKIAIKHGHTDLVLGALGCGVFNNPNKEVAIMFKNSINKYGHYFNRIGFAVLSGPGVLESQANSKLGRNPLWTSNNTNFETFKNILST